MTSNLGDDNKKESPRSWQFQYLPMGYVFISIIHSFIRTYIYDQTMPWGLGIQQQTK